MKLSDFYNSDKWNYPYSNDKFGIYPIFSISVTIPEIYIDDIDYEKNTRITIRRYHNPYIDGERVCEVSGVYLDNKPVMLYRHGGRGGHDQNDRFITDLPLYREMVKYLQSFAYHEEPEESDVFDADQDILSLNRFYNYDIEIGRGIKPREKS